MRGQLYFETDQITPSATISTYGAAATVTPPAPFAQIIPIKVGLTTNSVSAETITVRVTATFGDPAGTTVTATDTFTSNVDDISQALSYALWGAANGQAGQKITGKMLKSIAFDCQSSKGSSTATVVVRVFGLVAD